MQQGDGVAASAQDVEVYVVRADGKLVEASGYAVPEFMPDGLRRWNVGALPAEVLAEGDDISMMEKSLRARTGSRLFSSEGGRWAAPRASMTDLLLMYDWNVWHRRSVILKALLDADRLHGDCLTITGGTLADGLADAPEPDGAVVLPASGARAPDGGLAVLKGNLCPDGALLKVAGLGTVAHEGPALVFEDEESCMAAVRARSYPEGAVIVIRGEGPKGGPGMREMLGVTAALKRDSVWDGFVKVIALFGQAAPSFWLAILLIILLAAIPAENGLPHFPAFGGGGIRHLVLPTIVLAWSVMAGVVRLTRSTKTSTFRPTNASWTSAEISAWRSRRSLFRRRFTASGTSSGRRS